MPRPSVGIHPTERPDQPLDWHDESFVLEPGKGMVLLEGQAKFLLTRVYLDESPTGAAEPVPEEYESASVATA